MRPGIGWSARAQVFLFYYIGSFFPRFGSSRCLSAVLGVLFFLIAPFDVFAFPGGFIENRGQTDSRVLYYAPGLRSSVYFTRDAVVFDYRGTSSGSVLSVRGRSGEIRECPPPAAGRGRAVHMGFADANPRARIEARGETPTLYHFFSGADPAAWRTGVRAYREIVYRDLWPGVDVICTAEGGRVTCEIAALSSSDARAARFVYEGVDDGASFVGPDAGAGSWNPAATPRDPGAESVEVDNPNVLVWSTYLGGADLDGAIDLAVNSAGEVFVLGETYSVDFPATPGAYDTSFNGWVDVAVSKVSADGSSLVWSTFLASSDVSVADAPAAIAVDASGNPVVTGYTGNGFPVTPGAYDTGWAGGDDIFVTKLSADGSVLLWSTLVGGSDYEFPDALALYPSGSVFVTGATYSADFPTSAGAYDTSYSLGGDIFVFKLSSTGAILLWSTFVGGGEGGVGAGIAFDSSSRPVVTGYANSAAFPTTESAYDPTWNGRDDAVVFKLSSTGTSLVWSTFLGGGANDDGVAVALDASGNAIVAGSTMSLDFPATAGAYDETPNGNSDVYVAALSSDGTTLNWGTYLGGADDDRAWDLALDSYGSPVVAGVVSAAAATDFPVTFSAFDGSFNGGGLDGFVSYLWRNGDVLAWSSFLGGTGADEVRALALDASGDPYVTGVTDSPDFPTTSNAYDKTLHGNSSDIFVSFLDIDDPTGVLDPPAPSWSPVLSCAPNPFSYTTRVSYSLDGDALVDVRVFDVLGRQVAVLDQGARSAGSHGLSWDGRDARGEDVATGVYFVRLTAGSRSFERKVTVIR
jgi:hypothetical protein